MPGEASIAGTAYKSLMARLAALQEGIGPEPPKGEDGNADGQAVAFRKRVIQTYFACGLVTSLIVGCVALAPLLSAHPGAPRNKRPRAPAEANLAPVLFRALSTAEPGGIDTFDLPITAAQRSSASFPLQIIGVSTGDQVSVVVRDVPEATWLSSGERQDEHTWLLGPADLADLRLSLRPGTPETFSMTIDVAVGDQIVRSIARVRLVDDGLPTEPTAASVDKASSRPTQAKATPVHEVTVPFRTTTTANVRPADPQQHQKPVQKSVTAAADARPVASVEDAAAVLPTITARPTRPEGMSTLGAVAHDSGQDGRLLWWKMPLPSWAPFSNTAGRN